MHTYGVCLWIPDVQRLTSCLEDDRNETTSYKQTIYTIPKPLNNGGKFWQ